MSGTNIFISNEVYNSIDDNLRQQIEDVLLEELGETLQYEYSTDVIRKLERLGAFELAERFTDAMTLVA